MKCFYSICKNNYVYSKVNVIDNYQYNFLGMSKKHKLLKFQYLYINWKLLIFYYSQHVNLIFHYLLCDIHTILKECIQNNFKIVSFCWKCNIIKTCIIWILYSIDRDIEINRILWLLNLIFFRLKGGNRANFILYWTIIRSKAKNEKKMYSK